MNALNSVTYEVSDGYNTSSYNIEIFIQSIPTPTITSPVNNVSASVGMTKKVPLTLSLDYDPSALDKLEAFQFGYDDT